MRPPGRTENTLPLSASVMETGCPLAELPPCDASQAPGSLTYSLLRAGTLDTPEAIKPDVHIFTRSQVPWLELPKSARVFPAFYKFDEVWSPESLERWRQLTA